MNKPEFIDDDPVRFPHLFSDLRDIEITSLLVSNIAWGNRKMILRSAESMLALMDNQPYNYMMDGGYEELPDNVNIHRTFFAKNLKYFLKGLHSVYETYGTLQDFVEKINAKSCETPAWYIANELNKAFFDANNGKTDNRCLPINTTTSALKRFNMALRWLVRNDGIVDMGVWECLKPSQLYIPLDVHVGDVSRQLGLLTRKSNDRKAVEELTDTLRMIRPEDPIYFDFALFGIGVSGKKHDLS